MKTYRVFVDVRADNKDDARVKAAMNSESSRVQEDPFDDEEEGTLLEIARVALNDEEVYDYFADKLDLSDKELASLNKKVMAITNR